MQRRNVMKGLGALAICASVLPARFVRAAAPLNVVATTGMVADAVRRVGGGLVNVRGLMGPGVDPHSYRQTRTDIVAMTKADAVFWHGLYLEAQMESFFQKLERRGDVVAVAEALPQGSLLSHPDYSEKFDPHVWMDPTLWAEIVPVVRDALIAIAPQSAGLFIRNADVFQGEVRDLASYARDVLKGVPEEGRILLTAHDAFGYFGRAFDFDVVGIQGISTESEAGLNRIGELVDLLVDRAVGAVFVESSVSDRNIRALIEGAAARGHQVEIGGELFSDAMGEPGTYEGTYLGMIDHNVTVIARALGGTPPERGKEGRLAAGL